MQTRLGRGSDPALLWLWCRPVAMAPIQPLAWEPPYAARAAQAIATTTTTTTTTKDMVPGVPVVPQWLTNPTRNHEVAGSVPALAQWVNDPAFGLTIRRCRELWCRLQTRLGSRVAVPYGLGTSICYGSGLRNGKKKNLTYPFVLLWTMFCCCI